MRIQLASIFASALLASAGFASESHDVTAPSDPANVHSDRSPPDAQKNTVPDTDPSTAVESPPDETMTEAGNSESSPYIVPALSVGAGCATTLVGAIVSYAHLTLTAVMTAADPTVALPGIFLVGATSGSICIGVGGAVVVTALASTLAFILDGRILQTLWTLAGGLPGVLFGFVGNIMFFGALVFLTGRLVPRPGSTFLLGLVTLSASCYIMVGAPCISGLGAAGANYVFRPRRSSRAEALEEGPMSPAKKSSEESTDDTPDGAKVVLTGPLRF